VHALGLGTDGADTWVNPSKRSWRSPWGHLQFLIYTSAAGIDDLAHADRDYFERLVRLARAAGGGERHLLAFDHRYDADGAIDLAGSEFHVPNERVLELCAREPELFVPVGSVHPYRADALDELERLAAAGVRWIKWLPNAMGIDPADARCDTYYAAMVEHGILLISHAGEEQAVHAADDQELGNPLRLRRALDAGVTVVVAHCASLGEALDLDDPGGDRAPCFELFLRMMDDARFDGRLYGELSAVTQVNRRHVLRTLLERDDLHARLVDGTDYPLPAVNAVIHTGLLEREGFLTADERVALNAIYERDPLLFDLALKRTLRHPETGARFPGAIFTRRLDG
jgi:predicted TIM-barrel fold metal-dependent hydrolase